jgi:endonuclease/exonuclease/phosphatase family metal-dependent hydrolase
MGERIAEGSRSADQGRQFREWFANGLANDVSPEQQNQRIKEAAGVLRPINPDLVLLQEVRDYYACARLGEAIAPRTYQVAICSAFKEAFQRGIGKQQVAILAKYQAQAAWSEPWKSMKGVDPPRGLAFAWFKIGNEDVGVYSVHLKSNLITHGNKETETVKNIRKREVAITQLLAHVRDVIATAVPSIHRVVIGGDFNTNHDQTMFAPERTLDSLTGAAYRSVFEGIAFEQRITHPGSPGFPDATFDYLFGKNVQIGRPTITPTKRLRPSACNLRCGDPMTHSENRDGQCLARHRDPFNVILSLHAKNVISPSRCGHCSAPVGGGIVESFCYLPGRWP